MAGVSSKEADEAYRRFAPLVWRRCRSILRSPAGADDCVQDVFMKLMRYGGSYLEAESKVAWLYRTADNSCFDWLRRNRARTVAMSEAELATLGSDHGGAVTRSDQRQWVMGFLHTLNDEMQRIAVHYWIDDMSQAEIAVEIGVSRQTVNARLGQIEQLAKTFSAQSRGGAE